MVASPSSSIPAQGPEHGLIRGARDRIEARAVAAAIALPAVAVQNKGHGHAGTAMAMAPLAHVLFQRVLRHNPRNATWAGRDRFVLSAGHASLLLYTQLFLTGYDLGIEDIAASRTLDARTPGHPELGHTDGVEMSTGPLGQGVASAVGLALAARRDEALHGAGSGLWRPTVFVLAGDGCLQEGVSGEASSLAGTVGLDDLVLIWDDNRITIDGGTDEAFSEDVRARYRAYGWRVLEVTDFQDLGEIERVLSQARERTGAPTLVAVRSVIGAPAPHRAGTPAAHSGGFGEDEVAAVLDALGYPVDTALDGLVDDEILGFTRDAMRRGDELEREWNVAREAWRAEHPERAHARERLERSSARPAVLGAQAPDADEPRRILAGLTPPEEGTAVATRKANGRVIRALQTWGGLWGGSADLSESTSVAVPGAAVSAANPGGEFIAFGIREHAMAAVLTGIALHGLWRPFGSTYLAFSDYQRPSIRLAALMGAPAVYVYTHDSVAVGEDGPTHQPVEQIASLRTVPGLAVIRPADSAEVFAAWRRLLTEPEGPAALVLSRQDLPTLPGGEAAEAIERGGYVRWQHGSGADLALIATGSEVHLAVGAARMLAEDGVAVRVVSMPCVEWFAAAGAAWQESVLPARLSARVAVEAGRGDGWYRWVGRDGRVLGIDGFGESGTGAAVMQRRGITVERIVAEARDALAQRAAARPA
ncbi:transketolase family protein [Microbacterium sp. NPDC058342]|uniref:transketolase family protein n=1 Tax=Microbacterium sp. NPDC058342 TaxID=3346454 RepID=UPI00365A6CAF